MIIGGPLSLLTDLTGSAGGHGGSSSRVRGTGSLESDTPEGGTEEPSTSLSLESVSDPELDDPEELDVSDEESSESLLLSRSGADTSCPKSSLGETAAATGA